MSTCALPHCDRRRHQGGLCHSHWEKTDDDEGQRRVAAEQAAAEAEAIRLDAASRLAVLVERCRRLRADNLEDVNSGSLLESELSDVEAAIRACLRALDGTDADGVAQPALRAAA